MNTDSFINDFIRDLEEKEQELNEDPLYEVFELSETLKKGKMN